MFKKFFKNALLIDSNVGMGIAGGFALYGNFGISSIILGASTVATIFQVLLERSIKNSDILL